MGKRHQKYLRQFAWSLALLLVLAHGAAAQLLPVKSYTVADGLAHDEVDQILQDSHGFLWFCTTGGLSRFDGYRFTTYGVRDGLPSSRVNYMLESKQTGIYWIATNDGVSRFDPLARVESNTQQSSSAAQSDSGSTRALFTNYHVGDEKQSFAVTVIYEDRAGHLWVGSAGGLFRLERGDPAGTFQRVALNVPSRLDRVLEVYAFLEDREGSLWIGTLYGLVRRLPDGRMLHYPLVPGLSTDIVWALLADDDGKLWVGHQAALITLRPVPADRAKAGDQFSWAEERKPAARKTGETAHPGLALATGAARRFTTGDGLAGNNVLALHRTSDGKLWIGTRGGGLSNFDGTRFRTYTGAQGMSGRISSLTEDSDGNLWVATQTNGAIKISSSGLLSYREADGLGPGEILSIFENKAGELYVISQKWTISRFDGERFTAVRPHLPQRIIDSSSGRWWIIQDHLGEWWVATSEGLYRFPSVERLEDLARVAPRAVYTTQDGLADSNVSRLVEDSRGDIWIGSYNPPVMLTRWERATNTFQRYAEADGLPSFNWVQTFRKDAAGNLWLGMHNGGLVRYRNGRFEFFGEADGVPQGLNMGLYFDSAKRLWVATREKRAVRFDDPGAEHPRAVPLVAADEFASDDLQCFVEDRQGHLYIGTARGVERLDMTTGRVKHFTTADGLIKSDVVVAFRDRYDTIWFGTREGLSHLVPVADSQQPVAPPVLIGGLRIAGVPYHVSELGATEISGLDLEPNQNQIEIDFFGLSFLAGANLRYQYLLEGVDREWSAPTDQRTISTNLAPGTYRFLVRAVTADGTASQTPAIVSFKILRPVWQRWWFLTLVALALSAIVYLVFRYRVARAVELERVRTRIATDLHDDIGASLSQIAILSEVANQRAGKNGSNVGEPLQLIAGTSREMVDAMSDIVWAINPRKDHLSDLSQRMRRFASDILSARDINFRFRAPGADEKNIRLGADLRREVYLIFKESVNNLAKHSRCTEAEILFHLEGDLLTVKISDNGAGFDVERALGGEQEGMGGHGLASLRRRAENMGGSYEIQSEPGKGATVMLKIPLHHRPAFSLKKLLPKQVVNRRR